MSTSSNRYIQSVDGLRAVAVIAVLLYHLGIDWIPGGFLGVDLFFVISGYVITGLILDSIERSGGLDLRAFYLSRIRRLVPALIAMGCFHDNLYRRLRTRNSPPFSRRFAVYIHRNYELGAG